MKKSHFIGGYILGVLSIAACASVTKYYGLSLPSECYDKGTLLGSGSSSWPDLPFTVCKPDSTDKGKCVIQLTEDFFQKDADLRTCEKALSDCQNGNPPT